LDLNKVYNPLSAFPEYTTCPLPLRRDILQPRIDVDEKPRKPHDNSRHFIHRNAARAAETPRDYNHYSPVETIEPGIQPAPFFNGGDLLLALCHIFASSSAVTIKRLFYCVILGLSLGTSLPVFYSNVGDGEVT
jgi:hypothetical protein